MRQSIIYLSLILFLSSCGSVSLTTKPGVEISRDATLTIAANEDQTGTVGQLNHLLLEKGFNIMSYSTAKKAIKKKHEISGSGSTVKVDSESYSVSQLNSVYALELNYRWSYDALSGYRYLNFSARIIDLNTKELVMSASFRGDRSVQRVLETFTTKLSQEIRT
ncbi:hypothetical protein [Fodinibius saliphilus]|uniref:hypothetical protein n=1 Tax=Fodinibius saliphilus TaxID=1920650 RepID=UPI0011082D87|nr:hypothetical protein [Fodinibius saliphilus]